MHTLVNSVGLGVLSDLGYVLIIGHCFSISRIYLPSLFTV